MKPSNDIQNRVLYTIQKLRQKRCDKNLQNKNKDRVTI